MAVSVLFPHRPTGHIEVLDDRPPPNVVVDADGQLHAESGIVTYADEGLGRGTMALAVLKHPAT